MDKLDALTALPLMIELAHMEKFWLSAATTT